jgi:hypothetical protein
MSLPDPQNIEWAQYEDRELAVTMDTVGSVSGQTFAFTVREPDGTLVFQLTSAAGDIAITTTGDADTEGVVTVTVGTEYTELTEAGKTYHWDVWRTNSGQEGLVALGDLEVGRQLYRSV